MVENPLRDQTQITPYIQQITDTFTSKNPLPLMFEIISYLDRNLLYQQDNKTEVFRNRTAEQILKDGYATGCSDRALAFLVLVRALEFTADYAEFLDMKWLNSNDDQPTGHVVANVTIQGATYFVDPIRGTISRKAPSRMVLYNMGKDSWDIGISKENYKEQFHTFREKYKTGL